MGNFKCTEGAPPARVDMRRLKGAKPPEALDILHTKNNVTVTELLSYVFVSHIL